MYNKMIKYENNFLKRLFLKIKSIFSKKEDKVQLEEVTTEKDKKISIEELIKKFETKKIKEEELTEEEVSKLKNYYTEKSERLDSEIKYKRKIIEKMRKKLIDDYEKAIKLKEKQNNN